MERNTLRVFVYELMRNIRRKGFLFTTFGIPLLGIVIYLALQAFTGTGTDEQIASLQEIIEDSNSVVGYVDQTGAFPEPAAEVADMLIPFDSEEAARAAIREGRIDAFYVLPADYLETGELRMYIERFAVSQLMTAEVPLYNLIYGKAIQQMDPQVLLRIVNPANIQETTIQPDTGDGMVQTEGQFWVVYVFAIVFVFALFGTNGYLMQSVIEEKESRLVEILLSSVPPGQLLRGKVLAMGLLGLVQVGVWFATIFVVARLAASSTELASTTGWLAEMDISLEVVPLLVIYFILGYLMFAAVFSAVGALSTSMQEGPSLATFFTLPAMVPFFALNAFATNPNGTVPVILSIFPLTAPMGMIMRFSMTTNVPAWQVIVSIAVLILTVIGMMALAGRLFRVNTLLVGQVPKMREIPGLIFSRS